MYSEEIDDEKRGIDRRISGYKLKKEEVETKTFPKAKHKVVTREGLKSIGEVTGSEIRYTTRVYEPKEWGKPEVIEGYEQIMFFSKISEKQGTSQKRITDEERGLSPPPIKSSPMKGEKAPPPEKPKHKEFPPGYKKEEVDTSPSEEVVKTNLDRLPENVFNIHLGISKDVAEGFWKIPDFNGKVNYYFRKYVDTRLKYSREGNRKEIGNLHHEIDQIYARLMGHRTAFTPSDIPLELFKIKEPLSSGSDKTIYWAVSAALTMFARESRAADEKRESDIATGRERWHKWSREVEEKKSKVDPLLLPVAKFAKNITATSKIFEAFRNSWLNREEHFETFIRDIKDLESYFTNNTPQALYERAENERKHWYGMNIYDNKQYMDKGVADMPPWVKCGWKEDLQRILKENGFDPKFDCTKRPDYLKRSR